MSEIQTFAFGEHGVRVVGTPDAPLFVARDVCECLGLDDASKACERLDEDERGTNTVRTLFGGDQQMLVITESGLYSLVLTSRKPEAKAFKRWVTHEVLPTIRKTGAYHDTRAVLTTPTIAAEQVKWLIVKDALETCAKINPRTSPEAHETRMLKAAEIMTGADLSALMPQLEARTFSATEVGEQLGVSANKIGRLANALGIKDDRSLCVVTLNQITGTGYDKQVELYRYTPAGVERLKEALSIAESA